MTIVYTVFTCLIYLKLFKLNLYTCLAPITLFYLIAFTVKISRTKLLETSSIHSQRHSLVATQSMT